MADKDHDVTHVTFNLRMSRVAKARLAAIAVLDETNESIVLRRLIREEAVRRGVTSPEESGQ